MHLQRVCSLSSKAPRPFGLGVGVRCTFASCGCSCWLYTRWAGGWSGPRIRAPTVDRRCPSMERGAWVQVTTRSPTHTHTHTQTGRGTPGAPPVLTESSPVAAHSPYLPSPSHLCTSDAAVLPQSTFASIQSRQRKNRCVVFSAACLAPWFAGSPDLQLLLVVGATQTSSIRSGGSGCTDCACQSSN